MKFAKWVFVIAAIYGFVVLIPQYFMEERIGRDFPPPITHPEHFYGFVGVALAWQVAFLLIARDPVRFRPLMWTAMLEKVAFGSAAIVLYAQGRLALPTLAAGFIDLAFAALFFVAIRSTGRQGVPAPGAVRK
jgi:hypothetical protein